MNFKKCIGALVIVLSLLGISSRQEVIKPNQEIVLQFSNEAIKFNKADDAIASIKKLLLTVGVDQIQIHEQPNGAFKLVYFSNSDVSIVKQLLSEERLLNLYNSSSKSNEKPSGLPSEESIQFCDFKVFEIQKSNDNYLGHAGECIFVQKSDAERFIVPTDYSANTANGFSSVDFDITKAGVLCNYVIFIPKIIPYKIPEGRAGPCA